jgi:hypothetical protein
MIMFRLSPRDLAALDKYAGEVHGNRSAAVQRLIHEVLGRL